MAEAKATLNNADVRSIEEVKRLGWKWAIQGSYEVQRLGLRPSAKNPKVIEVVNRVQVRDVYNPQDMVAAYAVMMKESTFPSIIVTKDDWLADGNTRVAAALRNGTKHLAAIIIDVEYATGTPELRSEIELLATTLNAQNGITLTSRERRRQVETMLRLGWNSDNISRVVGVKGEVITAVRKEMAAKAKLAKVGLVPGTANGTANGKVHDAVKGASLRALGGKPAVDLNDDPYKALVQLSVDAGLNAKEIGEAARAMKEAGSDQGALSYVANLRNESTGRIRQQQLTGKSHPPAARELRKALGGVIKFAGQEHTLVEYNPDQVANHIAKVDLAVQVLQAAQVAQAQANIAPTPAANGTVQNAEGDDDGDD